MRRISVLALAFSACLASSSPSVHAAEPVETLITEWIAALDAAPDWSAKFADLTHDAVSDTAVLRGLVINHGPTEGAIVFEPISISGYVEDTDGSFGVASITSPGFTLTGDGLEANAAGIRFDNLGNVRKGSYAADWDPLRPFSSLIRVYARILDLRLEHAAIESLSLTANNKGEHIAISYEGLTIDGWGGGKVASISSGPLGITSLSRDNPISMRINGGEARNIDYAAMLRIYDPDQYVGGVGDGIWRNAVQGLEYGEIVVESPEGRVTVGGVSAENFRVRQPERIFNDFFDRAMLDPTKNAEPTPEELRAILGYLSSLALGSATVREIDVEAEDGGTGHLGEMRLVDASAERIGAFSLENFNISAPDGGNVDVGQLSVGGIVFPSLEVLIDAAEAEKAGVDFDYAKLSSQLAFFEVRGVDVDMPENPPFKVDRARLDLGDYVGTVPTSVAVDIVGVDIPATAIEEPRARAMWQMLGYDRLRSDFRAKLMWSESDERVTIDEIWLSIDDVGQVSFSAILEGLSRDALVNLDSLSEALVQLNFVRGTLALENYDILDRWIDQQTVTSGSDPAALRRQVAVMLADIASGVGNSEFQTRLRQVIEASVVSQGPITATAMPSAPVPFIALGVLAQSAPASLPDLLGVTIQGTSDSNR